MILVGSANPVLQQGPKESFSNGIYLYYETHVAYFSLFSRIIQYTLDVLLPPNTACVYQ